MIRILLLTLLLLGVGQLQAKNAEVDSVLQKRINGIAKQSDSLTYSKKQQTRWNTSQALFDSLEEILLLEESFLLNFDSFKTVSIQTSEDNRVRLFTWNYFSDSGFYTVKGILQLNPKYHDEFYFPLTSSATELDTLYQSLTPDQWIPALYYKIYSYKYKRKCYYMLTGYDGATPHLDKRVVECLTIDKKNGPRFGNPLFYEKDVRLRPKSRLVYKYASEATMVCRVEPEEKMIVISSLVPVRSQKKGNFEYYTPDGTYNYYEYIKGKWYFRDLLNDFKKLGNKELRGDFITE